MIDSKKLIIFFILSSGPLLTNKTYCMIMQKKQKLLQSKKKDTIWTQEEILSNFNILQQSSIKKEKEEVKAREEEKEECPICFYGYKKRKKITLPCNHSFHRNCINRWKKEKNTCPICRADMNTGQEKKTSTQEAALYYVKCQIFSCCPVFILEFFLSFNNSDDKD